VLQVLIDGGVVARIWRNRQPAPTCEYPLIITGR
jgi:hypothetical protein